MGQSMNKPKTLFLSFPLNLGLIHKKERKKRWDNIIEIPHVYMVNIHAIHNIQQINLILLCNVFSLLPFSPYSRPPLLPPLSIQTSNTQKFSLRPQEILTFPPLNFCVCLKKTSSNTIILVSYFHSRSLTSCLC